MPANMYTCSTCCQALLLGIRIKKNIELLELSGEDEAGAEALD